MFFSILTLIVQVQAAFRRRRERWLISHSSVYSTSRIKKLASTTGTTSEMFKTPDQGMILENMYVDSESSSK